MKQQDFVKLTKLTEGVINQMVDAYKNKTYLEAYLLAWMLLEQLVLPSFNDMYADKQGLEKLKPKRTVELEQAFYYLTHDKEVYQFLKHVRQERNKLFHNMYKYKSLNSINKSAKTQFEYVTTIISRLVSKDFRDALDAGVVSPKQK